MKRSGFSLQAEARQHHQLNKFSTSTATNFVAFVTLSIICGITSSLANPIANDQLSLSLSSSGFGLDSAHQADSQTRLMEQIMSDDYSHDFELSVGALNQLTSDLEGFVTRELVSMGFDMGHPSNIVNLWAAQKGGSSLQVIVSELDYIVSTFWTKFKPLIEFIVSQRPENLGPNDLDFRCKRASELRELKEMSGHSSIYSMYLDTFFSELHFHCLLRKLALIKNNHVAPSALVKQFVDIYLDLPTSKDPMRAASKELQQQAADQLLAGQAISFKLETALAEHGSLSAAAHLVFDPRTALSLTPDSINVEKMLQEFQTDCQAHNAALGQVWGEFDEFAALLTSQTCNLASLNDKVKLAAPQLVYASICNQLLRLPH